MDVMTRIFNAGIVPVVVIENAKDAVSTARALLDGGIDVMEITFRTAAASDAIAAVRAACPELLVGAGTVVSTQQCEEAVDAGACFIVSPGYCDTVVSWCLEKEITVVPGCVTPTEIMAALARGVRVLKFFPANIYGGLEAIKALAGPFPGVRFIPTGGVCLENLEEYLSSPFVHAVGGSWLCTKRDIATGEFGKITALCAQARKSVLGFALAHVGVNAADDDAALEICAQLRAAFDFETRTGGSSHFAGASIEVMKQPHLGKNGHIAIYTNSFPRAAAELERRGFALEHNTAKYKEGKQIAVYLGQTFGEFAVHLLQK